MGRGALLGSKCMKIKVSYVQARRFIDFHTLILNSYNTIYRRLRIMLSRKKQKIVAAIICGVLIVAMLAGIVLPYV